MMERDSEASTDSVTSMIRALGSTSAAARASATWSRNSGWASWRREAFTEMLGWTPRPVGVPAVGLTAGLDEDLPAQLDDQAGLLSHGNEGARRDVAPDRVPPAGQRLERDHPAGPAVDDRLVVDGQAVITDGAPQVLIEAHAFHGGGVHVGLEHPVAALPGPLGLVHGGIGVGQQPVRRGVVVRR